MIQVNGTCYIDVEIEGLDELTYYMFEKLIIKEAPGLALPVFELRLIQNNFSLLPSLRKANQPIKITYGTSLETVRKYDFVVYNYNYTDSADDEKYVLILTGMLDTKEFSNTPRIRSIEGTSDKVFSSISSLSPEVNYIGSDDQVWIQHNNSDKNFVERVLAHSYYKDDDFISGCITIDAKLLINSISKKFDEPHKLEIGNADSSDVNFDSIKVESDSALWSSFLSEGRELPVLNASDRSLTSFSTSVNSIIDSELNSDYSSNVNYPTKLNSMNCHDNYYQAWLNNLNYSVQFNRNNIYVFTSRRYLSNDELRLHDIVKFVPNDKYKNELVDPMSGKYILSEKLTIITQRGFGHRLKLNRDYNL